MVVVGDVAEQREADAASKSRSTEHQSPQLDGAAENRSLRRGDPHHRRSRHVLRVQHRAQSMGTLTKFCAFLASNSISIGS